MKQLCGTKIKSATYYTKNDLIEVFLSSVWYWATSYFDIVIDRLLDDNSEL